MMVMADVLGLPVFHGPLSARSIAVRDLLVALTLELDDLAVQLRCAEAIHLRRGDDSSQTDKSV